MILKRRTSGGKLRYGVRIDRAGKQLWVGTFDTLADARHAEARAKADQRTTTRMTCDRYAEFWLEDMRRGPRIRAMTRPPMPYADSSPIFVASLFLASIESAPRSGLAITAGAYRSSSPC